MFAILQYLSLENIDGTACMFLCVCYCNISDGNTSDDNTTNDSNTTDGENDGLTLDAVREKLFSIKKIVSDGILSATASIEDIQTIIDGTTAPVPNLGGGGGGCTMSIDFHGKIIDVGSGFDKVIPVIGPIVRLFLNITTLLLLIKIAFFLYRDLSEKMIYIIKMK